MLKRKTFWTLETKRRKRHAMPLPHASTIPPGPKPGPEDTMTKKEEKSTRITSSNCPSRQDCAKENRPAKKTDQRRNDVSRERSRLGKRRDCRDTGNTDIAATMVAGAVHKGESGGVDQRVVVSSVRAGEWISLVLMCGGGIW
ncbi:hypothetical protein IAQ61_000819 [Plenodomus lingam]|uniref:Uncharacterized protein n=1 Tax=Leptosphaeria maculans (strain JN3 / isolate v23.1.3 / race Av1-4-5-6-7-8) TaxID=985895 RepID=E5A606_LEPMJ|nr:predicted protein [Plenodomus lingam JN3]KAH9880526.1 hypothetical protein IAQ61_000819 [Plenodomus lingam]CBX99051.1 predicted protein [Plenodomus lingam JN3]